jgi:hypothetical protein
MTTGCVPKPFPWTAARLNPLKEKPMCTCGCQAKKAPEAPEPEKKSYVCYQCNTFKEAEARAPAPECCGKKMQVMD